MRLADRRLQQRLDLRLRREDLLLPDPGRVRLGRRRRQQRGLAGVHRGPGNGPIGHGQHIGRSAGLPADGRAVRGPDPVDVVINGPGDAWIRGPGSGGSGAGTLAGQTLTLKLNVALSDSGANPTGFGNYQLSPSFCTCEDGGGPAGPFTIPASILLTQTTVDNLLLLADQALAGANLTTIDPSLTYSDITSALDALNRGFDECRTVCDCAP